MNGRRGWNISDGLFQILAPFLHPLPQDRVVVTDSFQEESTKGSSTHVLDDDDGDYPGVDGLGLDVDDDEDLTLYQPHHLSHQHAAPALHLDNASSPVVDGSVTLYQPSYDLSET